MEILLMDDSIELTSSMLDNEKNCPLYYALKNGFDLVSHHILTSLVLARPSFFEEEVDNLCQWAPLCSENIVRLLFENCAAYMDKTDDEGYTVLHHWASDGQAGPCKILLESDGFSELKTKIFKELVYATENRRSDTPMHLAAKEKHSELAQILVRGYQQQVEITNQPSIASASKSTSVAPVSVVCPPWKITNRDGNTPLHLALYQGYSHVEFALDILSVDPTLCQIRNDRGESPLFIAVNSGLTRVVDMILGIQETRFDLVRRNDGTTVLHNLVSLPEATGTKLLQKYWWMIKLTNDNQKTALDKAKESNTPWLLNLLTNPSLIEKEPFDWVAACKREETQAVLAFIDHCEDLQSACREVNDTPLHHIKLPTYLEYLNLFQNPSIGELKNFTDHEDATPLHRALERKHMLLAKILLLDDEVERTVVDKKRRTAMDLLINLCVENNDWSKMCKQIKLDPYVKTTYIHFRTDLHQARSNLSVVAALLATITFAAAFSLPGGLDDKTGEARLETKAAFLVFLLADVFAMCTAILVLFYLIWSMVSETDMARLLVDRSVYILMASLYGTLLAFMTGIYSVIAKRSLWAAILVCVMCSIIGISTNRTVFHCLNAKRNPAGNKNTKRPDRMRSLEEGNTGAFSSRNDASRKAK